MLGLQLFGALIIRQAMDTRYEHVRDGHHNTHDTRTRNCIHICLIVTVSVIERVVVLNLAIAALNAEAWMQRDARIHALNGSPWRTHGAARRAALPTNMAKKD